MKKPVSVLVVIHTGELDVLLLERAAQAGFWQSVTGSQEDDEPLIETARREVWEETGIQAAGNRLVDWHLINHFEIFPLWRHRYDEGITHNDEHVFSLQVEGSTDVILNAKEHTRFRWLPWRQASESCFSWTNRDAICMLPMRCADKPAP